MGIHLWGGERIGQKTEERSHGLLVIDADELENN
jgi:hypothetical protein